MTSTGEAPRKWYVCRDRDGRYYCRVGERWKESAFFCDMTHEEAEALADTLRKAGHRCHATT